jgi:hypothetical protein
MEPPVLEFLESHDGAGESAKDNNTDQVGGIAHCETFVRLERERVLLTLHKEGIRGTHDHARQLCLTRPDAPKIRVAAGNLDFWPR